MHVLMVNAYGNDPRAGGVEKGIAMLSDGLAVRGHTVSYLNAFPGGRADPGAQVTVVHPTDWREDPMRRLRNHLGDVISRPTRALAETVARHDPDVVHTHNLPGISTGIWEVSRRLGLPVMHTLHDYHLLCPRVTMMHRDGTTPCRPHPLLCGLRTQRLIRWAGAVSHLAGVSAYLIELCAGLFPGAEKHVLRNPMFLPERPHPRRVPGRRLKSVGFIGGLDPAKGVDVLLSAAPTLEMLECELHVAGGGRLAPEVAAAAQRFPFVHYHGVVSGAEKDAFFEACDAGIIPSVWAEPGGPTHTLIEWLCSGRPVLVSRRGGLGEVIDLYPSAIGLEPTVEGVDQALRELAEPTRWETIRAEIRPVETAAELDRWIVAHEEIYAAMI
jgi:glycosyltransferase involved in cell wall biosynthesis